MRPGLGEYTLMPTHMNSFFTAEELAGAVMHGPLPFTRGMPVMRIPALPSAKRPPGGARALFRSFGTALYDIQADPRQEHPLDDPATAEAMRHAILAELSRHEATPDFYGWMGLSAPGGDHGDHGAGAAAGPGGSR